MDVFLNAKSLRCKDAKEIKEACGREADTSTSRPSSFAFFASLRLCVEIVSMLLRLIRRHDLVEDSRDLGERS